MKKIWQIMIECAVIGNTIHLLMALLLNHSYNNHGFVMWTAFLFTLIGWLLAGFRFGIKVDNKNESKLFLLGGVSLFPIISYVITCQVLQVLYGLSDVQNYNLFYFLGMPTLFWNKALTPIMELFNKSDIYIQLDINIVFIYFVIFSGSYLGINLKKYLRNKS
ncbi:MAG: hypothetical protein ACOWWH_02105 [Eubacteriaceae bacterium]